MMNPIIYSSNRELLEAISKVFSLGVVRKTEKEVIDFETKEVKTADITHKLDSKEENKW